MTNQPNQAPQSATRANANATARAMQITQEMMSKTLVEGGGLVLLACSKDAGQFALKEYGDMTARIYLAMAQKFIVRAREIETERTWGWQFDPKAPVASLPWRLDALENQIKLIFLEEYDAPANSEVAA